tara:strand:- start:848 stop:1873 length:1026 start_codon:yes stop_codon:yes gene_type:complete
MDITEIYVDPSINADSGTGTIGDPFGDLEYAIEQTTFDITNGTRVNIKAGTDEVVAAELGAAMANSVTTPAWAVSNTAKAVFQGYTSVAGDGGIGGISGGGSSPVFFTLTDHIHCIDLHMHNCGSGLICQIDNYCSVVNCEVNNGGSGLGLGVSSLCENNYVHDFDGTGISGEAGTLITNNIVIGNGDSPLYCINSTGGDVIRNILTVEYTSTSGINVASPYGAIENNSIWANATAGSGITFSAANLFLKSLKNNLIEGFSDTGGKGINFTNQPRIGVYGANSIYNCATVVTSAPHDTYKSAGANETLSVSPFTDPTILDFNPVDTGAVKEGSYPNAFKTV